MNFENGGGEVNLKDKGKVFMEMVNNGNKDGNVKTAKKIKNQESTVPHTKKVKFILGKMEK